jgi:hypothetical protein
MHFNDRIKASVRPSLLMTGLVVAGFLSNTPAGATSFDDCVAQYLSCLIGCNASSSCFSACLGPACECFGGIGSCGLNDMCCPS